MKIHIAKGVIMATQIETAATGYVKLSDPVAEQTFSNLISDRKILVKRWSSPHFDRTPL